MKLINNYIIKVIILIFCLLFSLEIFVCYFIYRNSKNIYKKIFDETLEKSKNKAKESMETMTKFIQNLLMNYITKLKLINKHIYLYNRKIDSKNENIINKNSKLFKNKNLRNKIIEAKTNMIYENKFFQDLFNKTTEKFDYIEYYNKKYNHETDNSILINKLSKEHEELNYISYYNHFDDEYDINNLQEEEIKELNFLIPIFKSIFIERFITKRKKMEINRIFILTVNELIIYPPEDAFKIDLFYTNNFEHCSLYKDYYYFYCIYIEIYYLSKEDDDLLFIPNYIDFNNIKYTICIKTFYFSDDYYFSFLCFDVNFGYLINNIYNLETKNFDFGLLKENHNYKNDNDNIKFDFFTIYNTNRKPNEVFEVFNNTEYTPNEFVIKDEKNNYFSFYHSLYLDTTKILKEHPELNIKISDIKKEYNLIREIIYNSYSKNYSDGVQVKFNKTTCRKKIISNEYECFFCEFRMSFIYPLYISLKKINDDSVDTNITKIFKFSSLAYSLIHTCPEMNAKDMDLLIKIKLIRIISFYFFTTFIIFFVYLIFINILSGYFFETINDLIDKMNGIIINEETGKIQLLKNNSDFHRSNEMLILESIYDLINNSLLIKEIFENEKFFENHKFEFNEILDKIKNKKDKEICNYYFGIFHFNHNLFILAEDDFKSTMNFLSEIEKKFKNEGINEYNKIKDEIKKSSMVPYLNEFSEFENIDENMVDIIKMNIYKQKLIYFYAMTKYKLANEMNNENKMGNKRKKEKVNEFLNEAIKYFNECKNINVSFGINQIKIIYSLIMKSKCYLFLKDYKNSIFNINEALNLFFNFSKIFNDYHSKNYNPKVMLFVETNIFQYILFNIVNICETFHKPCASNWITFNIFNTSPFLLSNVHYPAGNILLNFFDKNKNNMKKYDKTFLQNDLYMKEYDKIKKHFTKIVSRLYAKTLNNKNKKQINIKGGEHNNTKSIKNQTMKDNNISKLSSNLNASKYKSIYTTKKNRGLYKNITICILENILEKINFDEFKDELINILKKYFISNEKDTFGFAQFGLNGLNTKFFIAQPLNQFINKLNNVKNDLIFKDNSSKKKINIFIGIYDILETIINNYQKTEEKDNIIMLFIEAKDIRLSSVADCLNIVESLNDSNTSVLFFCFNEIIERNKINNIQSFLNGLIEGYFFQIKNYQQLKEIFANLSTKNYQSNFFKYYYDSFNNCL